jgi:hypothetical protein
VKIFPFSDPILLPLAPTIARTIADYLQLITQEVQIRSNSQNCADDLIEFQSELVWQWQLQRSIRQIPTLQYQYVSTIAHQIAAKSSFTSIEICQNINTVIPALSAAKTLNGGSSWLELSGWYNEASYIYLQLTPKSTAIWLNYIHDLPINSLDHPFDQGDDLQSFESPPQQISPNIDLAIYAHARCCSFLKLANLEKIVTIATNWQVTTPLWLLDVVWNVNRHPAEFNLIFEHPAEQRLIQVLMAVLDGIYGDLGQPLWSQSRSSKQLPLQSFAPRDQSSKPPKPPNWPKLTIDLAESWLEFYRHCQIFGDLKHQNPRLAMARCGLTAISRRYLQLLIENYVRVKAPVSL